jgi:hypothetical protein
MPLSSFKFGKNRFSVNHSLSIGVDGNVSILLIFRFYFYIPGQILLTSKFNNFLFVKRICLLTYFREKCMENKTAVIR